MESIIEIIKADPIRSFGAFIIIMAALSVSRDVVDQVKARINDGRTADSEWSRQMDKWGN